MTEGSGPGGIDLRGPPRAVLELVVRLRFDTGVKHRTAITANVSSTGMYVRALNPPPVGALAQFELDLPGRREPIRGSGEVVWIRVRPAGPDRPPGLGIRIRHIEAEALRALERAIEEHLMANPPEEGEVAWHAPAPLRASRPRRAVERRSPTAQPASPPPHRPAGPRPASRRSGREAQPPSERPKGTAGASPRQMVILGGLLLMLLFLLTRLG